VASARYIGSHIAVIIITLALTLTVIGDQTATKTSRSQYLRYEWQALAKIPAGTQPGALSLEAMARYRFVCIYIYIYICV
jgi:hypothetical protein